MSAPNDVRAQLERIVASQTLAGSDQLKRFLRLVVERTLDGKPEMLKEYNLGLEVFQRPPDYDPKVDPIVRVQARRLRSKLDEYYAGEGAHDSLVIHIPKGAYIPSFVPREAAASPAKPASSRAWVVAATAGVLVILAAVWMFRDSEPVTADLNHSIAVLPLKMFTEGGSHGHVADQATEVLTTELARNKQIRVLSRTTASKYRQTASSLPEIARSLGVRWVVEGGVGLEGTRAYVKLRAVDSQTDRKIWADGFDCELSEMVAANTKAANSIATAILKELRSPRS